MVPPGTFLLYIQRGFILFISWWGDAIYKVHCAGFACLLLVIAIPPFIFFFCVSACYWELVLELVLEIPSLFN